MLLIDSNQYLNLYKTPRGKHLLAPLKEVKAHIFSTQQIADEVRRNKLKIAGAFLNEQLQGCCLRTALPDHLFDESTPGFSQLRADFKEVQRRIDDIQYRLKTLTSETLRKIERSEDEVSIALQEIFAEAVPHSCNPCSAYWRKQLGNPPGKKSDPIGDELTWELFLRRCAAKSQVWIITSDTDYFTKFNGELFLNSFLMDELRSACATPEVFCFDDLLKGLQHFRQTTGIGKEPLPDTLDTTREQRNFFADYFCRTLYASSQVPGRPPQTHPLSYEDGVWRCPPLDLEMELGPDSLVVDGVRHPVTSCRPLRVSFPHKSGRCTVFSPT